MATLVDVICAPHDPTLPGVQRAGTQAPAELQRIPRAFAELRGRLTAAAPDVLVVVSGDHLNQWFYDNMPMFSIGKAVRAVGPFPHESEVFGIDDYRTDVHAGLARHLLHGSIAASFDLSWSDDFRLDHGFTVPLGFLRPEQDLPIVPVFTNVMTPPIAGGARFYELGATLARLIREWPVDARVAVLCSGHMSNAIGGPAMARFRREPLSRWDLETWDKLTGGGVDDLLPDCTWDKLYAQGNGTPGFLVNLVGAGMVGGAPPSWSDLIGTPFGPSCGFVEWDQATAAGRWT